MPLPLSRWKLDNYFFNVENMTIANALQLEAARRHASHFRFNYDIMPS